MDIHTFFQATEARIVAVFQLQRDLDVTSYVWRCGSDPMSNPITVTLPAGTLLHQHGYSNFGDGYSMKPVDLKVLGQMKDRRYRWFQIDYADIEYVHHVVEGSGVIVKVS